MAKCVSLQRTDTRICAGSLNKKIQIYERSYTAPTNPSGALVDYDEAFVLVASPWAMLQDINGDVIFNGISTDKVATTKFYIRFISSITSENWITFNNNRYDILKVHNLDENFKFMALDASIRGDDAKDASKS